MGKHFIPRSDDGLRAWALNLSNRISLDPGAAGLQPADAEQYAELVSLYDARLGAVSVTAERSQARVLLKDEARALLVADSRRLARIIQAAAVVGNELRILLGLPVPTPRRRHVPRPDHAPKLIIRRVDGHTIHLRLLDGRPGAGDGKARPADTAGATILSFIGEHPPENPDAWTMRASTTRTTASVALGRDVPPGTKIFLCAFWFNPRHEPGPACPPVAAHVGFDGPMLMTK